MWRHLSAAPVVALSQPTAAIADRMERTATATREPGFRDYVENIKVVGPIRRGGGQACCGQ